jgi:hypothetical protein
MAHFAELDQDNIVLRVIVVSNEMLLEEGQESEAKGIAFCKSLFGADTRWKQTSYNASFRRHYAGVGYTYNAVRDAFIPPQPFQSWTLDDGANWQPPVAMPTDGERYSWNESTQAWESQSP